MVNPKETPPRYSKDDLCPKSQKDLIINKSTSIQNRLVQLTWSGSSTGFRSSLSAENRHLPDALSPGAKASSLVTLCASSRISSLHRRLSSQLGRLVSRPEQLSSSLGPAPEIDGDISSVCRPPPLERSANSPRALSATSSTAPSESAIEPVAFPSAMGSSGL